MVLLLILFQETILVIIPIYRSTQTKPTHDNISLIIPIYQTTPETILEIIPIYYNTNQTNTPETI